MKILLILTCLLVAGCSTPRHAPRFDVPSTTGIHHAARAAGDAIHAAQADVKKLDVPAAMLVALNEHLFEAQSQIQTLEGSVTQLDTQLQQQTTRANTLAEQSDRCLGDKSMLQTKLSKSRAHSRWLLLGLIGAVGWILRKPLMALLQLGLRAATGI